jgi:hypothetical protein
VPHALGGLIGGFEDAVELGPLTAAQLRQLLEFLHLAQHLRLADDLAFQRGGDGKGVAQGRLVGQCMQARRDIRRLDTAGLGQQKRQLCLARPASGVTHQTSQRSQVTTAIAWSMPSIAAAAEQPQHVSGDRPAALAQQLQAGAVIDPDDQEMSCRLPHARRISLIAGKGPSSTLSSGTRAARSLRGRARPATLLQAHSRRG